ncbi:MAG: hydrogenase expression protein HypE [Siculibacillus sp.]
MSLRSALLAANPLQGDCRPWPRVAVDADGWRAAALGIAAGEATLSALWAERARVHMALLEEETGELLVLSLDCPDGTYPSVGLTHRPALRLERAIFDLWGLVAEGSPDTRPWIDYARWGLRHPHGAATPAADEVQAYAFLPAKGPPMHQIPVGPVHAGIIEPGHFRFTANGETVVRLEERLGWVHKGHQALMTGASIDAAARLAARVSGDATVAWSLAFARAVEAALGVAVPPRAHRLRALMAEVERLANHLGDFGAVCNDAAFSRMINETSAWRERTLRAASAAFGHRLMMDRVVPGGTTVDLADPRPLLDLLDALAEAFPGLVLLYEGTTSLQNRTVGTGTLVPELARRWGAGGHVGRASGRVFDARRLPGYQPYDALRFDVVTREEGDVDARVWVRIREIEASRKMIRQLLDGLGPGPHRVDLPAVPAGTAPEGMALIESFRGDVLVWLRLAADGTIAAVHLRDPSVFQWPLLEAAIEGNIVADFPLCNKSFNCSYSGHDL